FFFFFSSRRRHTRCLSDWSSDVCSSDLTASVLIRPPRKANSTRAAWVKPKLPPSPTTLQRNSVASTRMPSLVLSPTSALVSPLRSEERRVGKECRGGGEMVHEKQRE